METELAIKNAIEQSISHSRIVSIEITVKDIAEAFAMIYAAYNGSDVEHAETNDKGIYDVWGWTKEQQGTNEMDFRLKVKINSIDGK